jgi:hypothetical protein
MAKARKKTELDSFDAGAIGATSAETLRRFKALAGTIPPGRFFKTISSLTDLSDQAAEEFEAAAQATLRNEIEAANVHLMRGAIAAKRLKDSIPADAIPLPEYLRWKR